MLVHMLVFHMLVVVMLRTYSRHCTVEQRVVLRDGATWETGGARSSYFFEASLLVEHKVGKQLLNNLAATPTECYCARIA